MFEYDAIQHTVSYAYNASCCHDTRLALLNYVRCHQGERCMHASLGLYIIQCIAIGYTDAHTIQGFSSPRVRLTVEAPQLEHGVPSDTDTPSSTAGLPPSRRQRPLREVLANGTSPVLLEHAASLSGSDQEQSPESLQRPPSGSGKLCSLDMASCQAVPLTCCHVIRRRRPALPASCPTLTDTMSSCRARLSTRGQPRVLAWSEVYHCNKLKACNYVTSCNFLAGASNGLFVQAYCDR